MPKERICVVTPGQPSTNPRAVKEADALTEAGYDVSMICGRMASWADDADHALLRSRSWVCHQVGGHPASRRLVYEWTRLRHRVGRQTLAVNGARGAVRRWALSRVQPELEAAASRVGADLYIAHSVAGLDAAGAAASRSRARLGFDAEDFETETSANGGPTAYDVLVESVERRWLPRCRYMTAASPLIADA